MEPNTASVTGPLRRMVARECETLAANYGCFRESWDRRDIGRAVVNFERFRDANVLHMKWEESTLLEEFERRCRSTERFEIQRHRRHHEIAVLLCERLARLLASRMGVGAPVDDEITVAINELEGVVCAHRQSELDEVCARLDAVLSDVELHELEEAFERRLPSH